jgi:hypothetical protein
MMAWRWLWSSAIDPNAPIAEAELQRIATHAEGRAHFRNGLRPLIVMSPTFALFFLAFANIDSISDWVGGAWIGMLVVFVGLLAVFMASTMVEHHFFLARHIRRELRRRNYEVCERCGYWLEPLDASIMRCPECGADRKPLHAAAKSSS